MARRVRFAALGAVALFFLSGCEAAIRIGVDANANGGGRVLAVVTLDKDAQSLVGDLKEQLRTDDLKQAGWTIVGPEKVGTDLRVTASKPFKTAAGATKAVQELDGAKGLFKDFTLSQERGLFRTTTKFAGTVNLRDGIESFSDAELERVLGSPLGATPAEFEKRIGRAVSEALPITVGVLLPGKVSSNATTESDGSAAWHPKLGDQIQLAATARKWNTLPIALIAVAVLAAGTALIFWRRGTTTQIDQ